MLKRSTKITALMVVAASIISMVPAIAADVKKIDAEEGTVYYGKAKGNGAFIIDGQISGKEEDAVYYVADGKYNELKNADSGDTISGDIFEKKYIEFDDGDYYIDLTTGDKTEDSIAEDYHDDISTTVRKKLKNDNDGRIAESSLDDIVAANITRSDGKIFMNGAMGNWSEFKYDLENTNINGVTQTTIYSDPDGNYIDVDYNLGNFNVATTGDAVTIKNTDDTYEITKDDTVYELKAQIDSSTPLSEAYDYILRSAKISVWGREKDSDGSYTNMTNEFNYGSKSNNYDIANGNSYVSVVQKISKAQSSDDIDGIRYAKDASTYFLTDSEGDTQTLYYGWSTNSAGIVNWKSAGTKYYAQEVKLKGENGFYYADLGDSDNVDIDATSIGGGMLYCLSDGYIKMWNNVDSFEKLYKVDGSMNKISASNKDNIIVWNEDDEVYSIISNKATATTDATTTTTTSAAATATATGWVKVADGTWSFVKADGTKATAWYQDGTTWYYLNANGVMQTGWVNDNGTWYYCNGSGAMLANTTVDGYVLGANGAWVK